MFGESFMILLYTLAPTPTMILLCLSDSPPVLVLSEVDRPPDWPLGPESGLPGERAPVSHVADLAFVFDAFSEDQD